MVRGGESLVYLDLENRNVIKLNDAMYYATWLEFLNSVMLHNVFFPYTLAHKALAEQKGAISSIPNENILLET
jgi:hypothetical protein